MIAKSSWACATLTALTACSCAFGWGREGHAAIGEIARARLSPQARSHVVAILGDDNLAAIASWMDELRSASFHTGDLAFDPEAQRFNHAFPKNSEWHYVDLPLGSAAYTPDGPFSRPDDVVHEVEESIRVLEAGGAPHISPREALYMLVHFVGDLHQPLHVANGFYRAQSDGSVELVEDPAAARGLPDDKGANALFFGPGRYDELHAYWDQSLVEKIAKPMSGTALAQTLQPLVASESAAWTGSGDYHHWPESWATESVEAARVAYSGVTFGKEIPDGKGGIRSIRITLPDDYDKKCIPLAEKRIAQAGVRLAALLNAIRWPDSP